MAPLWTQSELAEALGGAPSQPLGGRIEGVSIDSRTLAQGDLFVAIKGETHDGHDHVARAFEAGASAAVISKARTPGLAPFGPVFAVDDTLKGLERLAVSSRRRAQAKIVAVTGSVGKTSVKEMLRVMLLACGETHASAASYNNHWGVPLTLARMPATAAYAVVEMGMNHPGEIAPLTRMTRPHVALVTTIAPVHIEYLGSLEAIADAKAEIFEGLELHGTAIVNRDAPQAERLEKAAAARGANVLTFGASEGSDARLLEVVDTGANSEISAQIFDRALTFVLGAPGLHMAQNAVGALLVAKALGADVAKCAEALAHFAPQKGRGARLLLQAPDGPVTIIDESYNANPTSMRAALALLGATKLSAKGRRIAVVGDMLELGPQGGEMHAAIAPDLVSNRVDLLFGAGPLDSLAI